MDPQSKPPVVRDATTGRLISGTPNPGGQLKELAGFKSWLLENALPEAKAALLRCLVSEDGRVQVAAAKEVLDRLFGRAPQTITGPEGKPLDFGSALVEMVAELAKRGK